MPLESLSFFWTVARLFRVTYQKHLKVSKSGQPTWDYRQKFFSHLGGWIFFAENLLTFPSWAFKCWAKWLGSKDQGEHVDGRRPAVLTWNIFPIFLGFHIHQLQLIQEFEHQPYEGNSLHMKKQFNTQNSKNVILRFVEFEVSHVVQERIFDFVSSHLNTKFHSLEFTDLH